MDLVIGSRSLTYRRLLTMTSSSGTNAKDGATRKRDHDKRQRDMGRKLAQWWVTPEEKTTLFVKLLEIRRGNDNG